MANKDELIEALDTLANAFGEFSTALNKADRKAWEQWKAGGYIVSDNVVSMYPSAQDCIDKLCLEHGLKMQEAVDGIEDCEEEDEEDEDEQEEDGPITEDDAGVGLMG